METSDCIALVLIDAYWSLGAENRRGHRWFRDLFARAAAQLDQAARQDGR